MILMGLGLIFIGMGVMGDAMDPLRSSPVVLDLMKGILIFHSADSTPGRLLKDSVEGAVCGPIGRSIRTPVSVTGSDMLHQHPVRSRTVIRDFSVEMHLFTGAQIWRCDLTGRVVCTLWIMAIWQLFDVIAIIDAIGANLSAHSLAIDVIRAVGIGAVVG